MIGCFPCAKVVYILMDFNCFTSYKTVRGFQINVRGWNFYVLRPREYYSVIIYAHILLMANALITSKSNEIHCYRLEQDLSAQLPTLY